MNELAKFDHQLLLAAGCDCFDVDMGSYQNQIELQTPTHMRSIQQIGCLTIRETICIDTCIAPMVQALWDSKIITTGCCCGHNKVHGYIGIIADAGQEKLAEKLLHAIAQKQRSEKLRNLKNQVSNDEE